MDDRALEERVLSAEQVFKGHLINVEHWQVALPDGQTALREIVLHRGAAAVVPVDGDGYVTLVRQHRVAANRFTWEIPAGKLDAAGEDMAVCAHRELEEETGLVAGSMQLLTVIDTTPGFCTERIGIYLATELTRTQMHLDEDEFIHVKRFPLSEVVARIMAGEIRDSKTIAGILMAQQKLSAADHYPLTDPAPIQRTAGAFSSRAAE